MDMEGGYYGNYLPSRCLPACEREKEGQLEREGVTREAYYGQPLLSGLCGLGLLTVVRAAQRVADALRRVQGLPTGQGVLGGCRECIPARHSIVPISQLGLQAVLHAHPTFCTALAVCPARLPTAGVTLTAVGAPMQVQRRSIPAFHYMIGCAGGKEARAADHHVCHMHVAAEGLLHRRQMQCAP